jgi:DnaJ-class molecular chaperone
MKKFLLGLTLLSLITGGIYLFAANNGNSNIMSDVVGVVPYHCGQEMRVRAITKTEVCDNCNGKGNLGEDRHTNQTIVCKKCMGKGKIWSIGFEYSCKKCGYPYESY